jgi:hypothetical protein
VVLNYKTSNLAKNSITPAIQPISPIPETAKFHPQDIILFLTGLYLTLYRKEAGNE